MIVTLLTDYGVESEFAGVCRGVVKRIAPDADVIDVTHGIPRHDLRRGALVLRNALGYLPIGVHVAVVDPQVGTERRALVVRCEDGNLLVGPDNGVLSLAWERSGGIAEAIDVSRSPHRLEPVSATFHGRDVFAPVAAHLAAGAEPADAGDPVDPDELQRLELPVPRFEGETLVAHVLLIDAFGNATLNVTHSDLAGSGLMLGRGLEIDVEGERRPAKFVQTFADVGPGDLLVYEDSYRMLALALNRGDVAHALRLSPHMQVRLTPR